ncbi:MAG: FAD-dependent monooxygenase [Chitinophagaceae bacterium]|nr:MAG: FAD-dependent monooxygenase [Chitinophagaceae bacterium]
MKKNYNDIKTTVVGGGLVGSLCTTILARKGFKINMYESRPDIRKVKISAGRSINLALSERGWKGLRAAGVEKAVKDIAIPMHGRQVHDEKGVENFQPYGLEGQSIYSVSRGRINQILLEEAEKYENVNLHFNKRCTDINPQKGEITFTDTQSDEETLTSSDLIFGADGAYSAIRYNLQKTDRFNYSQQFLEHGYKELAMPPADDGTWKIKKEALHIWPRKSFMLIALPNTDGSFTCTLFLPYKGEQAFEHLNTKEDISRFFNRWFPDVVPLIPDLEDQFLKNPTSSLVTIKCSPWVFDNKVALIGDAAHAIVPFYGQGMNAGFEDCRVLNDLLQEDLSIPELLQKYQGERKPNGDAIAELALRNFIEMRDKVADERFLFRKKIENILHQRFPDLYIPLYSMVTFADHIPYSAALRTGKLQDAFFEKIFKKSSLKNPESDEAVNTLLREWENYFSENN